ncbi:MAG: hypothetical protein QW569_03055 [Candidatus Bathyarchaeia archaeon]
MSIFLFYKPWRVSKVSAMRIRCSHTAVWLWVQRLTGLNDEFKPGDLWCILIAPLTSMNLG